MNSNVPFSLREVVGGLHFIEGFGEISDQRCFGGLNGQTQKLEGSLSVSFWVTVGKPFDGLKQSPAFTAALKDLVEVSKMDSEHRSG